MTDISLSPARKFLFTELFEALRPLYRRWRDRARQRAELARMSDREFRDMGISRAQVWYEVSKPFWRP